MRDGAREVEEAGSEDVRGTPTTRNTTTLDLSGAEGRDEEGLPETVPTEVWIDEDGLVRRIRQRLPVGEGGDVDYTLELYDFGVQATVQPPPEEDTIPFQEATRRPGRSKGAAEPAQCTTPRCRSAQP